MFCFNVAQVGQFHPFALVEFLLLSEYFFLCLLFVFQLCCLTYIFFISVSAVPVGASDRVAGLLNPTWWQR